VLEFCRRKTVAGRTNCCAGGPDNQQLHHTMPCVPVWGPPVRPIHLNLFTNRRNYLPEANELPGIARNACLLSRCRHQFEVLDFKPNKPEPELRQIVHLWRRRPARVAEGAALHTMMQYYGAAVPMAVAPVPERTIRPIITRPPLTTTC
jgi:hypothetical protein